MTADHRRGKWAAAILTAQKADGAWGSVFHSLAQPGSAPLTTEQALRRLHALGFTIADEPIRRCISTLSACLRGERKIDAYWEKGIDWAMFEPLMLGAWIRRFDPLQPDALAFAHRWARVAETGFASGAYDDAAWKAAYESEFHRLARHPQPIGFFAMYHAMLLPGLLTPQTERALVRHVLEHGMYYVCQMPLLTPPAEFASKATSGWLAALEILTAYPAAREELTFAAAHLYLHAAPDGSWDLGAKAADKVYFPLCDSWRSAENRRRDCTQRIRAFLASLQDAP